MVSVSPKLVKVLVLSTALGVVTAILYLVYCIFSALAGVISSFGSALVFLVCVWGLGRTTVQLLVFPGSFWLWRRSIESHFCREMASQTCQRIHDLRIALEILLDMSNERDKSDFLPRAYEASGMAKRMLLVIGETFEQQKTEGTLKPRQLKILELISELIQILSDTRLILSNSDEISLWEWIELESDESDWLNVVFEDFPGNTLANSALLLCTQIEAVLYESFGPTTLVNGLRRWFLDNTLGSLDQMRIELKSRYRTEQVWITTEDNKTIDCIWFMAEGNVPEYSTVMICNPNAGFYEFAYYQSEWLEFYLSCGVNVFMWNYRGYGRSMGRPSPKSLQKDAEVIVKYLKQSRGVSKLGVHGESLGGCIASHVANTCKLDFVFADRSLTSLADVAKYNFGWLAQVLFFFFTPDWRLNAAEKFIGADCFKIISADPKDSVINDLASLKTGVAVRTVDSSGSLNLAKYVPVLPAPEFEEFFKSLSDLMKACLNFNKAGFEVSPRGVKLISMQGLQDTSQSMSTYHLLSKDIDSMDDEVYNGLMYYTCNALENIDAGGKSLFSVFQSKKPRTHFTAWLITLEVWGSCSGTTPNEMRRAQQKAVERLQLLVEELQRLYSDHEFLTTASIDQVCRCLRVLLSGFNKLLIYLEDRLKSTSGSSSRTGVLLPLECGHSGPYSASERAIYETLLSEHGFVAN
jgi:hypothetical protein